MIFSILSALLLRDFYHQSGSDKLNFTREIDNFIELLLNFNNDIIKYKKELFQNYDRDNSFSH